MIGSVATITAWNGLNLVKAFSVLDVHVAVENDADSSALAEAECCCGRGTGAFLYVTVGTSIRCGLVFNGVLYRGVSGAHPELGHHIISRRAAVLLRRKRLLGGTCVRSGTGFLFWLGHAVNRACCRPDPRCPQRRWTGAITYGISTSRSG